MRTVPRTRSTQPHRRRSRRTRRSLALVFALVFAPAVSRSARAECVPFTTPPAISLSADFAQCVFLADVDGDGDLDVLSASSADSKIAWYVNTNGDGSSWSLSTISTISYGERAVVAADIDGDGDLDALAAGGGPKLVAWHENLAPGNGASWTRHFISTNADLALDVDAADLDGDGDLDAITASRFDNKIAWYENLAPGDGSSWTEHALTTAALFASSTAAADVDGDGDLDLLYTAYTSDVLGWFENSDPAGDASTWVQHAIDTANDGPYHVVAADVDGDGDLDAVTAFLSTGKVAWLENLAPGDGSSWTFHTITTLAPSTQRVSTADVDADGDLDVLVPSYSDDKVAWHENLGAGASWAIHTLSTSADQAQWVVAGDLDGDGDQDVASASQGDDEIGWYRNESLRDEPLFVAPFTILSTGDGVFSALAADVDGDGDLDALAASPYLDRVAWFENVDLTTPGTGDGSSWALTTVSLTGAFVFALATGDVDGDGQLDVLSASYSDNEIAWHRNLSPGDGSSWTSVTITDAATGARSVAAADVDGDGDLDALSAAGSINRIAWHENLDLTTPGTGDGSSWALRTIAADVDLAYSVSTGDVDGDGDLDVVSAARDSGELAWHENLDLTTPGTGDGSSWATHALASTVSQPVWIRSADLDGDGDLDLLFTARGESLVGWFENVDPTTPGTGDGSSWSRGTLSAASDTVFSVEAADVDGDGDLDALAASRFGATVSWFENLAGDGSAWTAHALSTASNYGTSAVAADLDGDGDLDVLSSSKDDSGLRWFENLGTGVFDDGFDSETPGGANLACWSSNAP